jgi:hypothetical protein
MTRRGKETPAGQGQGQGQKQIPFGDDNPKSNYSGKDKDKKQRPGHCPGLCS